MLYRSPLVGTIAPPTGTRQCLSTQCRQKRGETAVNIGPVWAPLVHAGERAWDVSGQEWLLLHNRRHANNNRSIPSPVLGSRVSEI